MACATGNEGGKVDPPSPPFPGRIPQHVPQILVSPKTNSDLEPRHYGHAAPTSQNIPPHLLYTPGTDIQCADSTADKGFRVDSGTS